MISGVSFRSNFNSRGTSVNFNQGGVSMINSLNNIIPTTKVSMPLSLLSSEKTSKITKNQPDVYIGTASKTNPDLSINQKIALEFGNELIELVKTKRANFKEIKKVMEKYIKSDKVKILSMKEYFGNKFSAAITRPNFNENGTLNNIELFIPEIDYSEKDKIMNFVGFTTHEVNHVLQFLDDEKNNKISPHYSPLPEGRFMNFVQKKITDMFTGRCFDNVEIYLFKTNLKNSPNSINNIEKFMNSSTERLPQEKIKELIQLGATKTQQKMNVNQIFNMFYDNLLKTMKYNNDENILCLINKYGGYEQLRAQIKTICAKTLKNEFEAYSTDSLIRKKYNNSSNKPMYYDLRPEIMRILSEAFSEEATI